MCLTSIISRARSLNQVTKKKIDKSNNIMQVIEELLLCIADLLKYLTPKLYTRLIPAFINQGNTVSYYSHLYFLFVYNLRQDLINQTLIQPK